jgi:capsid portal protein
MKQTQNFGIVNIGNNSLPIIQEDIKTRYNFIPLGIYGQDDFFDTLTAAYRVSTTAAACIEGIADLIYGKGVYTKNVSFEPTLNKLVSQECLKKAMFDLKLFGNAALQIYWNAEHTKIIKIYHVPVQTLRPEKITISSKIKGYYYCPDWHDQRAIKSKTRIPAFGTSDEKMEILYIKHYSPGLYYYALPDWISSLQFSLSEGEISNLHHNNILNGFLPSVMVNFNNGVPAPEERQTIEDMIQAKFTGTDNAGRFMVSFNDDPSTKPTLDVIQIDNLHEKFSYVAEYCQDRILVSHRVTSPLLFGIRDKSNGFSSQSEEMITAYSILQTMTINPFQNLFLNFLTDALEKGGYEDTQLYVNQLTPLAILSEQAEEQDKTVEEVEEETNKAMENPDTVGDSLDEEVEFEYYKIETQL